MSIVDERGVIVHPYAPAVLGDDPILEVERVARHVRASRLGHHGLAVVGVKHLHPQPGLGQALLGGVAGEGFVLRADVHRGGDLVDGIDVDDRRDPLDQVPVACLGLALTRLGLTPGRDVLDHALPYRPRSIAFDQQRASRTHTIDPSGRRNRYSISSALPFAPSSDSLAGRVPVVGMDQLHPCPDVPSTAGGDARQLLDLRRHGSRWLPSVLLVGDVTTGAPRPAAGSALGARCSVISNITPWHGCPRGPVAGTASSDPHPPAVRRSKAAPAGTSSPCRPPARGGSPRSSDERGIPTSPSSRHPCP